MYVVEFLIAKKNELKVRASGQITLTNTTLCFKKKAEEGYLTYDIVYITFKTIQKIMVNVYNFQIQSYSHVYSYIYMCLYR